ncbi:unnamed protein product, partial [Tetraodon nigroviridis]
VCFLGNGPSGICLSYLLSGYTAYLSPDAAHPNPLLQSKLEEQPHLSLLGAGPGVPVRGSGGTLVQSRGCALRLPAAAQQRLWTGAHLPAGVAAPARARHPSPGAGQRAARRGLAHGCSAPEAEPFSLLAHNVVLATGTHDVPARLGVEGESLPFVHHSFWELEAAISRGELSHTSDPVLVVGAGLTAADAVLASHHLNAPVYHVFRRSVADPELIFNQLPKLLYPEYHKIHQMMTQQQYQPSPDRAQNLQGRSSSLHPSAVNASTSASYSGYLSFPQCRVVKFRPDRKCVLQWDSGQQTVVQISRALVLIGALPNLSFLRDNGRPLGLSPKEAITCRRNPIDVDPYTNSVLAAEGPGMYAMGPLVGENFVRFLKGGASAIA